MSPLRRVCYWLALGFLFVMVSLFWNIRSILLPLPGSGEVDASSDPLTILIWHSPFHKPMEIPGNVCQDLYDISGCRLTTNQNEFNRADAVVFHHKELQEKGYEFPTGERPSGQKWIWASLESPTNMNFNKNLNNLFNWTLSYREESEIFVPYGAMVPHSSTSHDISNKTGLVTWVVSHYGRSQVRAQFVKEFSRHLKVDIYGRASNKTLCPSCLVPTIARYKFYLALENSVHTDYITEKLWRNSFVAGAVPVVLGPSRSNYEKFIPSDSFIHISDFPSPKHLADFLSSMSGQQYSQYFRWRERYAVKIYNDWRERFCLICAKYPMLPKRKIYLDLIGWIWNEPLAKQSIPNGHRRAQTQG
ncbi:hypothetical protein GDO86_014786 [Hymenochirus boettgeri]|uniref:Fucosyltransferase n=1 Tax=Hymenochirus boettgeri TaxID=247094 RepID=A0A8T2JV07_9PIPI|nr:hypothetical protein GDO86_014786 [Hymenochirus boettgeri]